MASPGGEGVVGRGFQDDSPASATFRSVKRDTGDVMIIEGKNALPSVVKYPIFSCGDKAAGNFF
ncbi:MAG: hypothetical protein LBI62_00535 [Candidatus Accumulibacter sp.]|nr:hypothetical protein [Accumulibacter sp.]